MLLGGCGAPGTNSRSLPAVGPTPTLAPARPLAWLQHSLPFAAATFALAPQPAISQADGDTAYWCIGGPTEDPPTLWATHNAGISWTAAGRVPATGTTAGCYVVVDDLDPLTIVAAYCVSIQYTECSGPADYLSHDGGATWAPVKGALPFFSQLATSGGLIYAITRTPGHSFCTDCTASLAISRDGMHTWTPIDSAITKAGRFATHFWLEPETGAILAETSNRYILQDELWLTTDGGAHWSRTPNPTVDGYFVRPLLPGVPWIACGNHSSTSSQYPTYPSLMMCTRDGGRTWSQVGGPYVNPGLAYPIAIALDGSILAQWEVPSIEPSAAGSYGLRRLALSGSGWGTTWEPLGPLPAVGQLTYASGTGTLWLNASNPAAGSAPGPLYTATYP